MSIVAIFFVLAAICFLIEIIATLTPIPIRVGLLQSLGLFFLALGLFQLHR